MSVYVDGLAVGIATDAQAKRVGARNGDRWCHLAADTTAELRYFAARIGIRAEWIQHEGTAREHFDLTPGRRARAVKAGAEEIDAREMVALIRRKREVMPIGRCDIDPVPHKRDVLCENFKADERRAS